MFSFLCHDFDGYYWPGRIWNVKDILAKVWKMEIRKQGLGDSDQTIHIDTLTYRVKLTHCFDIGDGTRWFEYSLAKKDEAGLIQDIFVNTNWRHEDHHFASADRALECAKSFLKQYELTGNLYGTTQTAGLLPSPTNPYPAKAAATTRAKSIKSKKTRVPDGIAPEDAYMYEK